MGDRLKSLEVTNRELNAKLKDLVYSENEVNSIRKSYEQQIQLMRNELSQERNAVALVKRDLNAMRTEKEQLDSIQDSQQRIQLEARTDEE